MDVLTMKPDVLALYNMDVPLRINVSIMWQDVDVKHHQLCLLTKKNLPTFQSLRLIRYTLGRDVQEILQETYLYVSSLHSSIFYN